MTAMTAGDPDEAEPLLDEATSVLRHAGPWFLTWALYVHAIVAVRRGSRTRRSRWCEYARPSACTDDVRALCGFCRWASARLAAHTDRMAAEARALHDYAPCSPATAPPLRESFDEVVVPHLHAAHRLARWLMRNEHDAEDVVQEASLRAFRYFRTFTGGNGRAWFLRIVRNTCRGWRGRELGATTESFDEERHFSERPTRDPEALVLQIDDVLLIERAMRNVPHRFRELLVLRELQGLSYRELADEMSIPMGTVMSRLSRAREALRAALDDELRQCGMPERTHPREHEGDDVLDTGVLVTPLRVEESL